MEQTGPGRSAAPARQALVAGRCGEASALLKAARDYVLVQQDVSDARNAVAAGVGAQGDLFAAALPWDPDMKAARMDRTVPKLLAVLLPDEAVDRRMRIDEQAARLDRLESTWTMRRTHG